MISGDLIKSRAQSFAKPETRVCGLDQPPVSPGSFQFSRGSGGSFRSLAAVEGERGEENVAGKGKGRRSEERSDR